MMWTGSDFEYDGINCTFTAKFNEKVKWEERVDTALSWFTDKKTPANLVMLYIEEPDSHGHIYGPDSPVVNSQLILSCSKFFIDVIDWHMRSILSDLEIDDTTLSKY